MRIHEGTSALVFGVLLNVLWNFFFFLYLFFSPFLLAVLKKALRGRFINHWNGRGRRQGTTKMGFLWKKRRHFVCFSFLELLMDGMTRTRESARRNSHTSHSTHEDRVRKKKSFFPRQKSFKIYTYKAFSLLWLSSSHPSKSTWVVRAEKRTRKRKISLD